MENITPQPKKKRGRKPKNNITINENPVFNNTLDTSFPKKSEYLYCSPALYTLQATHCGFTLRSSQRIE